MQHHQHHMMVGTISQLYFHIRQLPFLKNNRVNCVKTNHITHTLHLQRGNLHCHAINLLTKTSFKPTTGLVCHAILHYKYKLLNLKQSILLIIIEHQHTPLIGQVSLAQENEVESTCGRKSFFILKDKTMFCLLL